jgi:DnaJ-class molecular chaperone
MEEEPNQEEKICPACGGTGIDPDNRTCDYCDGNGDLENK